MNKFLGCVLLLATFLAGMMLETFRDTEPAKKAAYDRGLKAGLGKPAPVIQGQSYEVVEMECRSTRCLLLLLSDQGAATGDTFYAELPISPNAPLSRGAKFRVPWRLKDGIEAFRHPASVPARQ